jgi:hypothetical protein
MTTINFDLISDLNLDSLTEFSWDGKATSLYCIVAGNVTSNTDTLLEFLTELSTYYEAVFFLDGDLEHAECNGEFDANYKFLADEIELIDKVIYLHENIIIMDGATLLATNGWTTFDFTNPNAIDDNMDFLEAQGVMTETTANEIFKMAITDQHYMYNSIRSCQDIEDCENIVVITNSVPRPEFITHNDDYDGTILGDTAGNNGITSCLKNDTLGKVSTWIFGKYPGELDYEIDGVRYVNNPMIGKDLSFYYPKVISF